MPYYKGDNYRGDYYRGDPLLGAIVGAVAGGAVKRAAKWVGKQVGRATGRAGAAIGRAVGMGAPILRDAGAGALGGAAGYTLGQRIPQLGPIEIGGKEPKKYRRMNPLNPKALRRALRRAEGFEKFARKTVSGLRYGPKKFKSQRRAS